jgi:hypothetical protein
MRGLLGLLLALCLGAPDPASAQELARANGYWPAAEQLSATLPQQIESRGAKAMGLSFLLPGLGQHYLADRSRMWIFGALEVAGWAAFLERRSSGAGLQDVYRDFAWSRGRVQRASRMDGDFDYYEALTKWGRSGAFDSDPAQQGIQPEVDATTYNGTIWTRAQGLFLGGSAGQEGDPGYEQARAYYVDNAYGTEFLWDWSEDPAGQSELGDKIEESDERFRQATTFVGVIIANHLVSAIDAFITGRGPTASKPLEFSVTQGPTGLGWSTRVEIPVGR